MISSLFRQIDLFGKPVKLNFAGKSKSKSATGACFSFTFFGFVIWVIYQVGYDIISKLEPKIIPSESFSENPAPMIISPETFSFAFGLQNPTTYAHYINESIYTVEIKHSQIIREVKQNGTIETKKKTTYLALERCTTEHFGSLGPSFQNIELNELYCLQKEQPGLSELRIQGVYESPLFEDISINFRPCDPETSKVACASQATLDQILGSGYFAVYYTNRAINPKNYTNPSIGYRDSYYTSISNTYLKEITLSLSHLEVKSDIGWITQENKFDNFIKFENLRENINFKSSSKKIMTFLLRVSKITTYYERSYTKVQDIFAKANGLATAGLIVVFVLLAPYSNLKFYERLINELFDIKSLQQKNQDIQRKSSRQKSAIKNTKDENSKARFDRQKTLGIRKSAENNQILSPNNPKNLMNLSKSNFSDDESKGFDQPDHQPAERFESKGPLKKNITLNIPTLDAIDLKHIKEEKEDKILNLSGMNSPAAKSPNESSACLDFSNNKMIQKEFSPQRDLFDARNFSYKNQPHRPKPKAIQPQIKVLENAEFSNSVELQTVNNDNMFEKQEQNVKNFDFHSEEFQNNGIVIDNLIKEDNVNKANAIKTALGLANEDDEQKIKNQADELPALLIKKGNHINLSFGEYLCSFFWRSPALKEKFSLLDEGIKRIEERLDIFNVLKKFREVDKLKLLLLENEQYILFDTLPKPELSSKNTNTNQQKRSFSHNQLKEAKFISDKRKNDLIILSYKNLKQKTERTIIDEKLLEIYDDIFAS